MKIYIGSDHAGFELKEKLKSFLADIGHEVEDKGAFSLEPGDDYPDFVKPVAECVAADSQSRGVVIGKSGQGEAMCANRFKNARAAAWYGGNREIITLSRKHNNANILSLAAGFVDEGEAIEAIKTFLDTPFSEDDRHTRRISKIDN